MSDTEADSERVHVAETAGFDGKLGSPGHDHAGPTESKDNGGLHTSVGLRDLDDKSSKYVLRTAGFDARFPNTNQTWHCFQNYIDYFKCVNAKGDDFAPCKQFKRAYHSLCPNEWISRFDEQRESDTFPSSLEP